MWRLVYRSDEEARPRARSWRQLRPRQALHLADHPVEDLQPGVPETGVGDIHPQALHELVGARRTARGEELEVVLNEVLTALEVPAVDREGEQVSERIRIDVPGRVQ